MSNNLVVQAFAFAYQAHRQTTRKATNIPYITHPLAVTINLLRSSILAEDLLAAALLHDVVEDEDVTYDQLTHRFGERVSSLVKAVSEPKSLADQHTDRRKTWQIRKQHTIDSLIGASDEVKILSCADKVANLADMVRDHKQFGETLWSRFNAPKNEQKWYYHSLLEAYKSGTNNIEESALYIEFCSLVNQIFA